MDWQPIETAPKETRVLVYRPNAAGERLGIDCWMAIYDAWSNSRPHEQPTHWMPLPKSPVTE